MIYAPIIIPTLNRIEHLKRCISSLQHNAWAKYTPLIISVDYPPSAKYEEGYKAVCEYLTEGITGFAEVRIIYQEDNLGAYDNAEFLVHYVWEKYDRYIYMEDDIEASPNYIEYIDKGLELFEKREDIVAVCAAGVAKIDGSSDNVALTESYSAHGYGKWVKKDKELHLKICRDYFEQLIRNRKLLFKIAYFDYGLIYSLQDIIYRRGKLYQLPNGETPMIDQTLRIYLICENKYVIRPVISKVRNWGYDGSGVNCLKDNNYNPQRRKIDEDIVFDFIYNDNVQYRKVRNKHSVEGLIRVIVAFNKLWMWQYKKEKNC